MPFSMSASLFGARFTMRVGRARASRMARTRYTTLATQSVLRNQAYSRSKSSSSSSMFLLHLSMLSLLPLLFDSAHGQSAYGYVRGSSTSSECSDSKGKAREIHTSSSTAAPPPDPASTSSSPSCSSTLENHQSPPPIIAYNSQAPSYTASSSSSFRVYSKPISHRHPASFSAPPTPPAPANLEPTADAEVRSSTSSSLYTNDRHNVCPSQDSEPETFRVRRTIYAALARLPSEAQLSDMTLESMRELPVSRVCELIHSTIISDIRQGNSPFKTIHRSIITVLLSMADPSMSDKSKSVLETAGLWTSHLDILDLVAQQDVVIHDEQSQQSRTYHAKSLYFELIAEQVYEIIQTVIEYNWLEQQRDPLADLYTITSVSSDLAFHLSYQIMKDPYKATLAWLSQSTLQKARLDRQEIDHLLYETLPEFNELIWPMIYSNLNITHFNTNQDVRNYGKAVEAYELLLSYTKIYFPSKRYFYDGLLKMLMEFPVPPRHTTNPHIDSQTACAFIQRHEELFKTSHKFLLEALQGVLNLTPSGDHQSTEHQYKISFVDNAWKLVETSASLHPESFESSDEYASTVKAISWDLQSLTVLLKYAYRHLRSFEIGELLYRRCIEQALARKRDRLPEEEVDLASMYDEDRANLVTKGIEKYVKAHQIVDAIRIREATLLTDNDLVERVIEQSIERIASDSGWSEYTPPEKPRRLTQEAAELFGDYSNLHRKQWEIDVLLRCVDVDNMLVTAIISYWTATNQVTLSRYFMHYFFQMVKQVKEGKLSSSQNSSSLEGRNLRFVYKDLNSLPPLGLEMDLTEANSRVETILKDPEILVNLLNSARKMGNLSLAEKCWLVLCEEEDKRKIEQAQLARTRESQVKSDWTIPTAAYTIMLETYASEAASEREFRAEQRKLKLETAARQEIAFPEVSYKAMESTNGKRSRRNRLRSRITRKQRSKAEILHQRACLEFASSIYHRFAENLSLRHTDTRFFNAALSIFGGHTPEAAQARLDDTLRFRPRAQHHTDENSTAENADHAQSEGAVASSLITNIDLAAEGISMDKVESDAESTGSKSDSGFGSDTEKKQDLVIEQTPVYQFLEVVLQDIEAAGYIPPEWTSRYVNPDRAALIPATSADVMPTMSTRKASPLVRWTRHAEDAQRVFSKSRMPVVDDRGQSGSSRYQQ